MRGILAREFAPPFLGGQRLLFGEFRRKAEQFTAARKVAAFAAVGQESEVAYAHERGRQGVEQESADEFLARKGHRLDRVAVAAISVGERHAAGIQELPGSLPEALHALESDRDYLKPIFADDLIDSYLTLKYAESNAVGTRPHPYEFELYLNA